MWIAGLALFVVTLGFGIVVPLMPAIAPGASAEVAQFSALFVAYSAARILFQVPGGVWVDRAGATRVLRLALLAYALSLAGLMVPGGLAWFTAVRAIEGAATGLVYPAVLAIAAAAGDPDGLGRRVGIVTGVGSSGFLVGPVVGGALVRFGTNVPLAVGAAAALAVLVHLIVAPPPPAAPRAPRTLRGELGELGRMTARPDFLGLILPLAFNKLTFSGFQALLPLWGADVLDLGVGGVTALFALSGVLFALVQPAAGALADRVDARVVIAGCGVPLLLALAFLGRPTGGVAFGALYAVYILMTSSIFAATLKHAGRRHGGDGGAGYGGVYGVVNTATDLMTIAGPFLFLAVYGAAPAILFPLVAAIGLPFHAGFALLTRRRPANPPAG